jgi:hypothetical protein
VTKQISPFDAGPAGTGRRGEVRSGFRRMTRTPEIAEAMRGVTYELSAFGASCSQSNLRGGCSRLNAAVSP